MSSLFSLLLAQAEQVPSTTKPAKGGRNYVPTGGKRGRKPTTGCRAQRVQTFRRLSAELEELSELADRTEEQEARRVVLQARINAARPRRSAHRVSRSDKQTLQILGRIEPTPKPRRADFATDEQHKRAVGEWMLLPEIDRIGQSCELFARRRMIHLGQFALGESVRDSIAAGLHDEYADRFDIATIIGYRDGAPVRVEWVSVGWASRETEKTDGRYLRAPREYLRLGNNSHHYLDDSENRETSPIVGNYASKPINNSPLPRSAGELTIAAGALPPAKPISAITVEEATIRGALSAYVARRITQRKALKIIGGGVGGVRYDSSMVNLEARLPIVYRPMVADTYTYTPR